MANHVKNFYPNKNYTVKQKLEAAFQRCENEIKAIKFIPVFRIVKKTYMTSVNRRNFTIGYTKKFTTFGKVNIFGANFWRKFLRSNDFPW